MEEWVGYKWHQYITRQALGGYPDQAVTLREQARTLGLLFRALGGDPALHLVSAEPRHFRVRRRLLHRIAGTHRRFELAWRDADSLRLPERIALFPDRELNRALYLWLAALAASPPSGHDEWFTANQAMTEAVLTRWPGLEAQYQQLVRHILQGRPRPGDLPEPEAAREEAIRQALIHPGSVRRLPPACHDPWPVFLWLYPVPETEHGRVPGQDDDSGTATSGGLARKRKRRKAERVEAFDKDRGLMIFRLESLFSWSEFIPVDRAGDDTEEKDAEAVADDMDLLSVSGDRREASASIRLDLDLPAEDHDDLRLGPGIHLPEWDWRRQDYREKFCCLQPMLAASASRRNCRKGCGLRPGACNGSSVLSNRCGSGTDVSWTVKSWTWMHVSSGRSSASGAGGIRSSDCSASAGKASGIWPVWSWPIFHCPPNPASVMTSASLTLPGTGYSCLPRPCTPAATPLPCLPSRPGAGTMSAFTTSRPLKSPGAAPSAVASRPWNPATTPVWERPSGRPRGCCKGVTNTRGFCSC